MSEKLTAEKSEQERADVPDEIERPEGDRVGDRVRDAPAPADPIIKITPKVPEQL